MPNIGLKINGPLSTGAETDLVLDSSNTTFAADINALGANKKVFLKESITITAAQEITVNGVVFERNADAKIIYAGASALAHFLKVSASDCKLDICLEHAGTGTATAGLIVNGDDNIVVEDSKIEMNNASGTLTSGFTLETGSQGNSVKGLVKTVLGTVTGDITDNSGNTANDYRIRNY